jgi:hypothetical protein
VPFSFLAPASLLQALIFSCWALCLGLGSLLSAATAADEAAKA